MSVTMVRRAALLAAFAVLAASTTFLVVQRQQSSRPGEVLGMVWGDTCSTKSTYIGTFSDTLDAKSATYKMMECKTITGVTMTYKDIIWWHRLNSTTCHYRSHDYRTGYWSSWGSASC